MKYIIIEKKNGNLIKMLFNKILRKIDLVNGEKIVFENILNSMNDEPLISKYEFLEILEELINDNVLTIPLVNAICIVCK